MNKEDALKIISDACAEFKGNLKDHQIIQKALKLLNDLVNKPEQEKPE